MTKVSTQNCVAVAAVMKSLAHPERLRLLCELAEGELHVSELLRRCDLSQSQLSQFLRRLELEGILSQRREGNFSFYAIRDARIHRLIKQLHKIYCHE